MIRDIRGLIEAEKFPLTPVIQGSLFEMLSNELWLKVQSTNINFKELGRLVQAEEFFEFSLDHHHIFERYIETPMQALIISSALKIVLRLTYRRTNWAANQRRRLTLLPGLSAFCRHSGLAERQCRS